MTSFDVILVGGGLANGLLASRLAARQPALRVLVVESALRLGGNHTWSYHQSDVAADIDSWLSGLVRHAWARQDVMFPGFVRSLETGYRTLLPGDLHDHVASRPSVSLQLGTRASELSETSVTLAGGATMSAPCVIDGRGIGPVEGLALGYQTFLGLEVETREPHGLAHPIIMDASVAQHDGYRFVYSLPMSPTRILIEDTYYADTPDIARDDMERRIHDYAAGAGWRIARVERSEQGLLPIVLDGSLESVWPARAAGAARIGMRAGLFHQTTGYSLPLAAEAADTLSGLPVLTTAAVAAHIRRLAVETWSRQSFFRMINRLLFLAARPDERQRIMRRFYGLDAGLIERFYAGRLTAFDMARILTGKPPIPIWRALGVLDPRAAAHRKAGPASAAGGPMGMMP